jgi:hypothetical protein
VKPLFCDKHLCTQGDSFWNISRTKLQFYVLPTCVIENAQLSWVTADLGRKFVSMSKSRALITVLARVSSCILMGLDSHSLYTCRTVFLVTLTIRGATLDVRGIKLMYTTGQLTKRRDKNSMELGPSWEVTGLSDTNVPTFYGTRRSITVFTTALHVSLSSARSIQSTPPNSISLKPVLIFSYHLCLGLLSSFFLLAFPPKSYMHFYFYLFVLHALPISTLFIWSF